jgi:hypothetical protein
MYVGWVWVRRSLAKWVICVMLRCSVCSYVVDDAEHSVRFVEIYPIALVVENAFAVEIAIDAFVDSVGMALDIERDTVVETFREVEV